MKKIFIFISLLMSGVVSVSAQAVQTATLQKSVNDVQVFYGSTALQNASDAAVDGNVIYLSAGSFGEATLSKSIKVIGAGGFNTNPVNNTVINNLMIERIGADGNVSEHNYTDDLELEGFVTGNINFKSSGWHKKINFKKISFNSFNSDKHLNDVKISQCLANNFLSFSNGGRYINVLISNSIINSLSSYPSISAEFPNIQVSNSIIYGTLSSGVNNMELKNNIIVANGESTFKPSSVLHNIFTGENNYYSTLSKSGNWENVTLSNVFVNQPENKWDASYDYHLKNPQNYIGTDGTQVGIYGGLFPWNPIPSNPRIIESKVNATTTNDGKLNFQIKAEAQQ